MVSASTVEPEQDISDEARANGEKRLADLTADFQYKYQQSIILWCPTEQLRPDYVASLLGKQDPKVKIHNHWVSPSVTSAPMMKVWRGAVAEFTCISRALDAARELRRHHWRSLRVITFEQLLSALREAELLYPEKATPVAIFAPKPFGNRHINSLKSALSLFGMPEKIVLYTNRSERGVVAKVHYPSQLQAYAARVALCGMRLDGFGLLTTELDTRSSNGRLYDFHAFVKEHFIHLVHYN